MPAWWWDRWKGHKNAKQWPHYNSTVWVRPSKIDIHWANWEIHRHVQGSPPESLYTTLHVDSLFLQDVFSIIFSWALRRVVCCAFALDFYTEGILFKSQIGDQLSWPNFVCFSLVSSGRRQVVIWNRVTITFTYFLFNRLSNIPSFYTVWSVYDLSCP